MRKRDFHFVFALVTLCATICDLFNYNVTLLCDLFNIDVNFCYLFNSVMALVVELPGQIMCDLIAYCCTLLLWSVMFFVEATFVRSPHADF